MRSGQILLISMVGKEQEGYFKMFCSKVFEVWQVVLGKA